MPLALAIALVDGCSGAPLNKHAVTNMISNNIHVRRPGGRGADPTASPGGIDYRADVLPNERMDCETLAELFRELNLALVRQCLASIRAPVRIVYRLKRDAQPYFFILEPEKAPPCVTESLARIPVPREVVFQNDEEGDLRCFTARLDLEADEFADVKLPIARFDLSAALPLPYPLTSDSELVRVLAAWTLTPFFEQQSLTMTATLLPQSLCRACMTDKGMLKAGEYLPSYWPSTGPATAPDGM